MRRLAFLLWLVLAAPALALDPSEMLADPELEARARALDHDIRCVKCQSEVVASSNADWAKDARRQIRELISDGASDAEVKQWFLDRYGEFVLMNPPKSGSTLALWLAGPAMLLTALLLGGAYIRRRAHAEDPAGDTALSEAEEARLREILKD
ncbi:cytochrome c-type biogenesis protein CcmH [Aliishimia ponticola]|uniref:Cytochrome c-type biogenesis protein n=1 Tax=Aliishimia ponticola TaxID=2499833 RepID=A0A4S4NRL6_9RHOB|nr:cytochrome c-type biogenesis protein [Aliishimia ponticola]THH38860.1 cytochrome c-type biogenesis protein CcmH [Aliishimia ponticola]